MRVEITRDAARRCYDYDFFDDGAGRTFCLYITDSQAREWGVDPTDSLDVLAAAVKQIPGIRVHELGVNLLAENLKQRTETTRLVRIWWWLVGFLYYYRVIHFPTRVGLEPVPFWEVRVRWPWKWGPPSDLTP